MLRLHSWHHRNGRLLPEGQFAGPMPWVIAIMMFLSVLIAAGGLGIRDAARHLSDELAGRITIQMVEADPFERARQTQAVLRRLATLPGVAHVERVDPQQLEKQLAPWLGTSFDTTDVPIPDMVDVDLASRANALSEITQAVKSVAPSARIDAHGQWLTPLNKLMNLLKWLALALVVLMAAATAFTVVLAARATLDNHRDTIDVMHLLGGTDVQIARLFQRRIALDALFGGIVGLAAAAVVLLLLVERVRGLGSELVANIALTSATWTALILFPLGGTALAMVTARLTILRTLGRIL